MNEVLEGLALLKDAFKSQMEELALTEPEYWLAGREICEIDYMIERIKGLERRRQRSDEERIRNLKRDHDNETRRRILLGIRMDSVSSCSGHGLVHFRGNHLGGRYGKKNGR